MAKLEPSSNELAGIGPNRGVKVRERYDWLNSQIDAAIEEARQARKSAGLSDLSEDDEQRIADRVAAEFRAKEADSGPPAPESLPKTLASAVSPRKGTSFEEAKRQASIVSPEYESKATPFSTIKEAASTIKPEYAKPGALPKATEVGGNESLMQRITAGIPSLTYPAPTEEPAASFPPAITPSSVSKAPAPPPKKPAAPTPTPTPGATKAAAETPIQKIVNKFRADVSSITGAAKKELEDKTEELDSLEKVYRQEAQEAKSDLEKRELAETMGHALAQFGAGLYGMKQGIDMSSGLKFNKTDWNRRYEQALDELKSNLADLREKRQEARLRTTEAAREKIGETQFATGLEAQEQARRESEAAASARARAAQAAAEQERKLDRESREKIATLRSLTQHSLAAQKLSQEEEAAANGALGSLVGAWAAVGEAEDDKEKKQAEKRALMLESDPKITRYFSPQAIQQARKLAVGTPSNLWNWWSGQEADLAAAQQALETGRAASAAPTTPAAPVTGQTPAAGGTVWRRGKDGKEYEYDVATKLPTGKSR